jgi:hypothetical protein
MGNVLFVGLGGTGIKTLVQIKQQLMNRNPEGKVPDGVEFLGIDTIQKADTVEDVFDPNMQKSKIQQIVLDGDDFVTQSGYLKEFIQDPDNQHLDWMNKHYYINHPQKRLLTLENGAGMHRQIGRLALLKMLEAAQSSPLYEALENKLRAVSQNVQLVDVLVFGSLAGGTGASMVNDIPYLAKHITQQLATGGNRKDANVYGFFALPDAFEHTPNVNVDANMRARAIATLREYHRFSVIRDKQLGYELVYTRKDATGKSAIAFKTEGQPYEIIHLFDQRDKPNQQADPPNPLNTDIAHGVCATMASYAWMFADPNPGNNLRNALVNRSSTLGKLAPKYNGYNPLVCATFGAFSYVLPLGAMVESWTYQFARDVLRKLVPMDGTHIARNRFGRDETDYITTSGREEVASRMGSSLEVINHFVEDVVKTGATLAAKKGAEQMAAYVSRFLNRNVSHWVDVIRNPEPTQEQLDVFEEMKEENTYFCEIGSGLFGKKVIVDDHALVELVSLKANDNDPVETANELIKACQSALDKIFNHWSPTRTERVQAVFVYYKNWLKEMAGEVLNGTQAGVGAAKDNKAGKLGWLEDFLEELIEDFAGTSNVLKACDAYYKGQIALLNTQIAGTESATDLISLLRRDPSQKNQKAYIEKWQEIFSNQRLLFLAEAEAVLVDQCKAYTQALYDSVRGYLDAMVSDGDGNIVQELNTRRNQINIQRSDAGKFSLVRQYIYNEKWETKQYTRFTGPDTRGVLPIDQVLTDITWTVGEKTETEYDDETGARIDRPVPIIRLSIGGFPLAVDGILRSNEVKAFSGIMDKAEKKERVSAAVDRFAARCRPVFRPVWDNLTVMDYLTDQWSGASPKSPQDFADQTLKKIDGLLRGANPQQSKVKSIYYLIPETNNPGAGQWASAVHMHMQNTINGAQNRYLELKHQDPTTFTLISYVDFVDFQDIDLWAHINDYLALSNTTLVPPVFSRPLLHVYKAEQNAARYEQNELLPPGLVGLFENPERLLRFVDCLVLSLIKKVELDDESIVFAINIPDSLLSQEKPNNESHHLITLNPRGVYTQGVIPPLFQAAEKFCLAPLEITSDDPFLFPERSIDVHSLISQMIEDRLDVAEWVEGEKPHSIMAMKYKAWLSTDGSGKSQFDALYSQFREGLEFDNIGRLEIFSLTEEKFVHWLLPRLVSDRYSQYKMNSSEVDK